MSICRHIPRVGSSDLRPPGQRGPGPHSEGVRHPEDSAGSGSHGLAGLLGICDGRSLVRRWAHRWQKCSLRPPSIPLQCSGLELSALSAPWWPDALDPLGAGALLGSRGPLPAEAAERVGPPGRQSWLTPGLGSGLWAPMVLCQPGGLQPQSPREQRCGSLWA